MSLSHQVQLALLIFITGDHRVTTVIGAIHVDDSLGLMLGIVESPQAINALVGYVARCGKTWGAVMGAATHQTEHQQSSRQSGGINIRGLFAAPSLILFTASN